MRVTAGATPRRGGPATPGRGGPVLIGALVVDAIGNGLFLPLSLVFFTRLTDVPVGLLGVLISVANAATLPIPVWAGSSPTGTARCRSSSPPRRCTASAISRTAGPAGR